MDSVVLHKRSEISGSAPPPGIIECGEIAINSSKGDESLYILRITIMKLLNFRSLIVRQKQQN